MKEEAELIELLDVYDVKKMMENDILSAAEICLEKYDRVYQAVEAEQKVTQDDILDDTCALCIKHETCEHCGLYIYEGVGCSDKTSIWNKVHRQIGIYEEIYSSRILEPLKPEILNSIQKLIDALQKVEDGDYDEDDYKCEICGEVVESEDDLTFFEDNFYCESCKENDLAECYSCDKLGKQDDMIENEDGDYYCNDCYSEKYSTCDICECELNRDEAKYPQYTDEILCQDCYDDKYTCCTECDEEIEIAEAREIDNEYYCETCAENKDEEEDEEEDEEIEKVEDK